MSAALDPTGALKGRTVLIVEDEAIIALGVAEYLQDAGADRVTVALSLAEAIDCAAQASFDYAILDVRMPDGTTYQLADHLVEQGCAIIFHSGHAQEEDVTARFPEARFCSKPCRYETFMRVIADIYALEMQA